MKPTPYTTKSGLQIGCNYTPPAKPYEPSRTEVMLQRALLKDKSPVDTSGIWIVVITGLLMALPYIILAVRS